MCIFIRAASGLDGIVYLASGLHGNALQAVWLYFVFVVVSYISVCVYPCSLRAFDIIFVAFGLYGNAL